MTSNPILAENHRKELRASAISDEVIASRGYATVTNPKALPPEFTGEQRRLDGLLIPIRNTQGEIVSHQLKPRIPRTFNGKTGKYEQAKNGRICLDVPDAARPYLLNPEATLWITEGAKKVDSAVSNGIPCTIGLPGVWMWQQHGPALPDWRDIALKGREVVIAFDSDVMTKSSVRSALEQLTGFLRYRNAIVRFCLLPQGEKRDERGVS